MIFFHPKQTPDSPLKVQTPLKLHIKLTFSKDNELVCNISTCSWKHLLTNNFNFIHVNLTYVQIKGDKDVVGELFADSELK